MKKTLLICATGAILQMCFFTGCSDDKSKDTQESSQGTSVETSHAEMSDSDTATNTLKEIVLPEMEIEDDTSETSQSVSVQSDKEDTANNNNKVVTTKAVTTAKTPVKDTATTVTTKNNTSGKETTTQTVTTAVPSESKTTVTTKGAIELPEIDFN